MAQLSGSPRLARGALVGVDLFNPIASVIVFQYNPDTVTRTVRPQGPSGEGAKAEAMRLKGAPVETITLDLEIDATDQLETGDATTERLGISPQLSSLEMLAYPKVALVVANTVLMAAGTLEVLPPIGPFTVLVWNYQRVLPVRISEFTITEELHDAKLNPIQAKVAVGLQVLSYNDLSLTNPGYHLFLAHQTIKEVMASISGVRSVGDITQTVSF
jgi:hypothetical protein